LGHDSTALLPLLYLLCSWSSWMNHCSRFLCRHFFGYSSARNNHRIWQSKTRIDNFNRFLCQATRWVIKMHPLCIYNNLLWYIHPSTSSSFMHNPPKHQLINRIDTAPLHHINTAFWAQAFMWPKISFKNKIRIM
jgi:hypothetical protein